MQRMALVTLTILALVVTALGVQFSGILVAPVGASETLTLPLQMTQTALIVTGGAVLIALVTLLIRPRWLFRVLTTTSFLLLMGVALVTTTVGPLMTVCSITCLAAVTGRLLRFLIPGAPLHSLTRAALDLALGFAALGLLWFTLGATGLLAPVPIVMGTLTTLALLGVLARNRDVLPAESVAPPGIAAGIATAAIWGMVLFALLGAFVPESQSDAIKQHLPIAREYWQSQRIIAIDQMPVSLQSIQQHLLFAVAFGFGGPIAAQLLQAAFGVTAILGVAALAWELGGRTAATCAAALFGLMPITLWELGHAFIDVLPVVFTTAAALCVLQWQGNGNRIWLVIAGALCGVGVTTKMTVAAMVVAMTVGILLVGRSSWQWRDRVASLACFGLGLLSILPWLVINTAMTGRIYGSEALTSRLSGLVADTSAHAAFADAIPSTPELAQLAAYDEQSPARHGLRDLIAMPWLLTFNGEAFAYPIIGRGELGIAPLVIAPFALLMPRRRTTAMLVVIVFVSFFLWWLTPLQILRHLLPCGAIAAALLGTGVAVALDGRRNGLLAEIAAATLATCLVVSLAITPVFFLARPRAAIPVTYLIGQEDRTGVLADSIRTASLIQALDAYVPPDTRVAYLGRLPDAPQLYTEARLVYLDLNSAGETPAAVLETLQRLGIRYVLWERSNGPLYDSSSVVRSTAFLRQYARVLAGDDNAYLFEILPDGGASWGEAQVTNLLKDPDFRNLKGQKSAWDLEGRPGAEEELVTITRKSSLSQKVPVEPGVAYLLETPARCLEDNGRAVLSFYWLDANGTELASASESIAPGSTGSNQFLWRRAPAGSATLRAEIAMTGAGRCEFAGAALFALP